jgi:hypothetical protein
VPAVTGAVTEAAGAVGLLSRAVSFLGGPFGVILGLLATVAIGFLNWGGSVETTAEKIDKLKGKLNEVEGTISEKTNAIARIRETIDQLNARSAQLENDPIMKQTKIIEVKNAFADLGLEFQGTTGSIGDLITALEKLEGKLQADIPGALREKLIDLQLLDEQLAKKVEENLKQQTPALNKTFAPYAVTAVRDSNVTRPLTPEEVKAAIPKGLEQTFGPDIRKAFEIATGVTKNFTDDDITKGVVAVKQLMAQFNQFKDLSEQLGGNGAEDVRKIEQFQQLLNGLEAQRAGAREQQLNQKQQETTSQAVEQAKVKQQTLGVDQQVQSLAAQVRTQVLSLVNSDVAKDARGLITERDKLLEETKNQINILQAALDDVRLQLQSQGKTPEEIESLIRSTGIPDEMAKITSSILSLGDEKAAFKAAKASIDAQKKALQKQIQLAVAQAKAGDASTSKAIQVSIGGYFDQLKELDTLLAKLRPGSQKLTSDEQEALDAQLQERDDEREKINLDLIADQGEKQKQIIKEFERSLTAKKDALDAEISKLRDEAKSLPDTSARFKELMRKIDDLIQQRLKVLEDIASQNGPFNASRFNTAVPNQNASETDRKILEGAGGDRYFLEAAQFESGRNPNAVNRTPLPGGGVSAAYGLFQFIPSTLAGLLGIKDVAGLKADILSGKFTLSVEKQVELMRQFTAANDKALQDAGLQVTDFNRYVLHQQGSTALLTADPNARAGSVVKPKNLEANGLNPNDTVAQVLQKLSKTFEEKGINPILNVVTSPAELDRAKKDATLQAQQEKDAKDNADTAKAGATNTFSNLKKTLDRQEAADQRALDSLISSAKGATPDDIKKLIGSYDDLQSKIIQAEIDKIQKNPDLTEDDKKSQIEDKRRELQTKAIDNIIKLYDDLAASQDKVSQQKLDQVNATIQRASDPRFSAQYSDQDRTNLEKQKLGIEDEVRAEHIKTLQAETTALKEREAQLEKGGNLDAEQKQLLLSKIAELEAQITGEKGKQNALSTQGPNNPSTFTGLLSGARGNFQQNAGIDTDGRGFGGFTDTRNLSDMQQVVGDLSNSFAELFKNLANGSMKAKDAIKSFATSIISSIQNVIAKRLADKLVDSLFNLLPGFGGGASGAAAAAPVPAAANGLYIRRALGGSIPGMIRAAGGARSTRDDTLVLAQQGEYILRQSAVQAIGKKNLDEINALGNRHISQGNIQPIQSRQPDNVNVYVVPPDDVPVPGPKDIVHVIARDIQSKGAIRTLIKQVQVGGA